MSCLRLVGSCPSELSGGGFRQTEEGLSSSRRLASGSLANVVGTGTLFITKIAESGPRLGPLVRHQAWQSTKTRLRLHAGGFGEELGAPEEGAGVAGLAGGGEGSLAGGGMGEKVRGGVRDGDPATNGGEGTRSTLVGSTGSPITQGGDNLNTPLARRASTLIEAGFRIHLAPIIIVKYLSPDSRTARGRQVAASISFQPP